jgi:type IV pilus assembly protein PilP
MSGRILSRAGVLLAALSLTGCIGTDMSDLQQEVARIKRTTPGVKLEPPPKLVPYKPFAYAAYGLRNPFEEATFLQQMAQPNLGGPQPNLDRPKELLEEYALESLEMVGTINKDGLWVLVAAPDSVIHRVSLGNYMGTNHGQIVGLSDRRVDLVEIVPDGLGGWEQRESFLTLAD